jgi:NitT/TauT family transport system permease protein
MAHAERAAPPARAAESRDRGRTAERLEAAARRGVLFALVLAVLWGLWEGYRWIGIETELTWPFAVNDTTMPHLHGILAQLFEPSRTNGPLLISVLFDSAVFTAKEAAAGFALGAVVGFALAVVLAHSRLLQRGFLPYIVASQTVPILAIAPMVVVWLGSLNSPAWFSVAVIAAYLTFFPVTINALRGLQSADPRALELMRSYAASRWKILWKLRVPASLPYVFSALRVAAAGSVVGAIVGELPSSIQDGLGGAILNFAQYYTFQPKALWATNVVAALLGIVFFLVVVIAERLVVRRAPEHIA